jgi:uncharacterized protein (DUF362 family)
MSGRVRRITDPDASRRSELLQEHLTAVFVPERGRRYTIKPNLSSCRPHTTGATTNPELVRLVVGHLRDHGAEAVLVELPPHVRNIDRVLTLTGFRELAQELKVDLVVPDRPADFLTVGRVVGKPCRVSRVAWESAGIVNLPKLKTHLRARFSGAVKNLFGLTDMHTRHAIHVRGLQQGIAQMYRLVEPRVVLNVLDGAVGMQGQGPTHGEPFDLESLWVAVDAVQTDLEGIAAAGFASVGDVPYLADLIAGRRGATELGSELAGEMLARAVPAHREHPRADYLREALTTQPLLRRLLQRLDWDFLSERRPQLPESRGTLDSSCRFGAIVEGKLVPERCTLCYECLGSDPPIALEAGVRHKLRVLKDLVGRARP